MIEYPTVFMRDPATLSKLERMSSDRRPSGTVMWLLPMRAESRACERGRCIKAP